LTINVIPKVNHKTKLVKNIGWDLHMFNNPNHSMIVNCIGEW
jgi:hypothetical protein